MESLPHTRNLTFCTHSARLLSFSRSCFALDQLNWKRKVCSLSGVRRGFTPPQLKTKQNEKFVDNIRQCFAFTTHQAKIQICSMVKLIPWNLVNLSHLYLISPRSESIRALKYIKRIALSLGCTEWFLFMFERQIENHFLFNCLQASVALLYGESNPFLLCMNGFLFM